MLYLQIQNDLKNAVLARDEVKVSALRLLISEIRNKEIEKRAVLSDEDVVSVVQKEAKKRKEAAEGFRKGAREDSALKEEAELKILEGYLPEQISTEELTNVVSDTISELGAVSMADMGKVIGAVMAKVKGRAEGSAISAIVKEKLGNA